MHRLCILISHRGYRRVGPPRLNNRLNKKFFKRLFEFIDRSPTMKLCRSSFELRIHVNSFRLFTFGCSWE
jgi:arginyl-tRNA--protein-N-Asp/Glu arginylyltransferase